jgi:tripartite-type tricarboxylate transporter receptor subunit TctC
MKIIKFLALALLSFSAHAWEPTKPIKVLLGQAPGAGNELSFRAMSMIVNSKNPNANFIYDYKPGADGNIAHNMFNEAAPDGYTVAVPSLQGQFVTGEIWFKDMIKYDPLQWNLITVIAKSPLCIVANPKSTVNTVPELLDTLKRPTRNINFAIGGGAHKVAFTYMMEKTKSPTANSQVVFYKGPAQAVMGVATGDTEFGIMPIAIAKPLIEGGKVKLIALIGEQQLAGLPKTPLMKDYVPGMNVYAGWIIALPPGTPQDVLEWYETNFTTAIRSSEARRFFEEGLMFTEEREIGSKGARQAVNKLREQWIPIVRNMKAE